MRVYRNPLCTDPLCIVPQFKNMYISDELILFRMLLVGVQEYWILSAEPGKHWDQTVLSVSLLASSLKWSNQYLLSLEKDFFFNATCLADLVLQLVLLQALLDIAARC